MSPDSDSERSERLHLPGPRSLWWVLSACGVALPVIMASAHLAAPTDPGQDVRFAVRLRTLLWRAETWFGSGKNDAAIKKPAPAVRHRASVVPPRDDKAELDELLAHAALADAAAGENRLPAAGRRRAELPRAVDLVLAHAIATRADAWVLVNLARATAPSGDLRAAMAALASEATAVALALPPTEAAARAARTGFGNGWGTYTRDRIRARVYAAVGDDESARTLSRDLRESDGRIAPGFLTVAQILVLAALAGLAFLVVAAVRANVARSKGDLPWAWLRDRYTGLGQGVPYPRDSLVPVLGFAAWLVGYMASGLLASSVPGGRSAAGLATLFQGTAGILIAQAVVHAFARDAPAMQTAARLGGPSATPFWKASTAALRAWCVLLPAVALAAAVSALFVGDGGQAHPVAQYLLDDADPVQLGALAIAVAVVAPIGEELLFRGFLYRTLRQRWGVGVALLGSSLLFALMHMSPSALLPYLVLGLGFGLVYEWVGSLWAAILLHGLWNLGVFGFVVVVALS